MFRLANEIGKIGEDTACVFLMKQGFRIIDRNYWRKWGEIDIIAEKEGKTRFIEVKAVTRPDLSVVPHETGHSPLENVHRTKLRRLRRVIETYMAERGIAEGDWQFDVIAAYLDTARKQAKIEHLENVIL